MKQHLTLKTFNRFSEFITAELGIKMPPTKKTMLQGRLMKRMRKLGFNSYDAYFNFVFSDEGKAFELMQMMDVVTTNKTDFFREPKHFDFLLETVVPDLMRRTGAGKRRKLALWSAGCSSGAEPYTMAMVLEELGEKTGGLDYAILATDICTTVLKKAITAIYREDEAEPVPLHLKKKYLLRSKNKEKRLVRIVPELRARVNWSRLNFMDPEYGIRSPLDIIFCRNVIIYFDRKTQETVLNRLCRHLKPGGYLFMGHSETLNGLMVPLRQVSTTIYQKTGKWN